MAKIGVSRGFFRPEMLLNPILTSSLTWCYLVAQLVLNSLQQRAFLTSLTCARIICLSVCFNPDGLQTVLLSAFSLGSNLILSSFVLDRTFKQYHFNSILATLVVFHRNCSLVGILIPTRQCQELVWRRCVRISQP